MRSSGDGTKVSWDGSVWVGRGSRNGSCEFSGKRKLLPKQPSKSDQLHTCPPKSLHAYSQYAMT